MRAKTPVTIDDVAAAAGVSRATVSRVLNRSLPVAEATAARVRAAADQLGYVPQAAARNLAQGATNTLGLLLPGVSDDFFSPLVRSITERADEGGYTLLIAIRPRGGSGQAHQLPLGKQNTDSTRPSSGPASSRRGPPRPPSPTGSPRAAPSTRWPPPMTARPPAP